VFQQFDIETGFADNTAGAQRRVKLFLCPASDGGLSGDAVTHYVAMSGIGRDAANRTARAAGIGFMGYDRATSMTMIEDGSSQTIALLETRFGIGPWARGGSSNVRGFESSVPVAGWHDRGFNAAMADGSVWFISFSVEPNNIAAAITIAGGEPVILD
jgi:prepilin-type processing-associated H-X9-DG protein